jgi:hypothetical protein
LEIASKIDVPIAFLLYDWEVGEQKKAIPLKSIFILRQQPTMHSTTKFWKKDSEEIPTNSKVKPRSENNSSVLLVAHD